MSEEKHIGKNTIASFYGLGISGTFVLIGILVGVLSWGVSGSLVVVAAAGTADGLLTSIFGMRIYGGVFAAPFVALSLFPKALDRLPRSGSWMETIKIVFGFIEVAAAVKFLWVPDLEW